MSASGKGVLSPMLYVLHMSFLPLFCLFPTVCVFFKKEFVSWFLLFQGNECPCVHSQYCFDFRIGFRIEDTLGLNFFNFRSENGDATGRSGRS